MNKKQLIDDYTKTERTKRIGDKILFTLSLIILLTLLLLAGHYGLLSGEHYVK